MAQNCGLAAAPPGSAPALRPGPFRGGGPWPPRHPGHVRRTLPLVTNSALLSSSRTLSGPQPRPAQAVPASTARRRALALDVAWMLALFDGTGARSSDSRRAARCIACFTRGGRSPGTAACRPPALVGTAPTPRLESVGAGRARSSPPPPSPSPFPFFSPCSCPWPHAPLTKRMASGRRSA